MKADGSSVVNITDNPATDVEPAWSPDGTRIGPTLERHDLCKEGVNTDDIANYPEVLIHFEASAYGVGPSTTVRAALMSVTPPDMMKAMNSTPSASSGCTRSFGTTIRLPAKLYDSGRYTET